MDLTDFPDFPDFADFLLDFLVDCYTVWPL